MITKARLKKIIFVIAGILIAGLLGYGGYTTYTWLNNGGGLSLVRSVHPLNRSEGWREDLHFLVDRMLHIHPNLFYSLTEEDFERAVTQLDSEIPNLTDNEIILEFMGLVALGSREGGRDGHTEILPFQEATGFHVLPLRLYLFSDGWFVVDAQEPYQNLIGRQLVRIGDFEVDQVYIRLDRFITRDNTMTVKEKMPLFFLCPEVLQASGVIQDLEQVLLTFDDGESVEFETSVRSVNWQDYLTWVEGSPTTTALPWIYVANPRENFSLEYREDIHMLYIQYNAVRSSTQSGETIQQFSQQVEMIMESNVVDRVVVDIRHNSGGNNYTYPPLLNVLSQNKKINQPDKLFTIIGRKTFSAAMNFATEMERKTLTHFVGEPTGGSPNQYGDAISLFLPNSGLEVEISSFYWEKSDPDDERLTIEPDILIELSSEDFFTNRDPAIEAILKYQQ